MSSTPSQHLQKTSSAASLASAGSLPGDPIDVSSQYETADDGDASDNEKKSPEEELGECTAPHLTHV